MNTCPRTFGLRVLARKWSYFTLRALLRPKRFNELKNELHYITNHVLSRELQLLVDEQLVSHTNDQYYTTSAGRVLLHAAEPLYVWSQEHLHMNECSEEQRCSRCARYAENTLPSLYVKYP